MDSSPVIATPHFSPGAAKVIFVIGATRSGSTLLALLLGNHAQVFAAGELGFLWERGIIQGQLCGCGEKPESCPFWRPVVARLARGISPRELAQKAMKLVAVVESLRHVPRLLAQLVSGYRGETLRSYLDLQRELVAAMASASGKEWIVDSAKSPVRALAFTCDPDLRSRSVVIHLVRDPRGVAFSRASVKRRPEITDREAYMDVRGYAYSAVAWVFMNALSFLVGFFYRMNGRYRFLRYEDLAERPREILSDLAAWLALEERDSTAVEGARPHTISGNPIRFEPIDRIAVDVRWKQGMTNWENRVVRILTWPWFHWLGYRA